jgi:hypothetical protein
MSMGYQQIQPRTVNFEWISESWQMFLANAGVWVLAMVIFLVISQGIRYGLETALGLRNATMAAMLPGSSPSVGEPFTRLLTIFTLWQYWVILILNQAVTAYFVCGFMKMANAQVRGQKMELSMMFSGFPVFPAVFAVQFVVALLASFAFLFCFFPMFVVYGLFFPAIALAADGETIGDSFSKSLTAMSGSWPQAALFTFVLGMLMIVGTLGSCFIGIVAVLPMLYICQSLAYRDMVGMPGIVVQDNTFAGYEGYGSQPGVWPPPPGTQPSEQSGPLAGPQPNADRQTSAPYMPGMGIQSELSPPSSGVE